MKPAIAPSFRSQFQQLTSQLPQATLLSGETGIGLATLARVLAGSQLEQVVSPVNAKGEPDDARGSIGVDTVRGLYESTRGRSEAARVVIIDNAERMTPQAQNAYLKLLEEPPVAMKFILTSHQPSQLLPTVRSRVQQYQVPRISQTQSSKLLDLYPQISSAERSQLLFVAVGRPALLHKLANNPNQRQQLVDMMRLAREFITSGRRYDRLQIVAGLMGSRDQALDFVECCLSILWHQLSRSADPVNIDLIRRMLHAHSMLMRNANPRLQLTRSLI